MNNFFAKKVHPLVKKNRAFDFETFTCRPQFDFFNSFDFDIGFDVQK